MDVGLTVYPSVSPVNLGVEFLQTPATSQQGSPSNSNLLPEPLENGNFLPFPNESGIVIPAEFAIGESGDAALVRPLVGFASDRQSTEGK